MFLAFIWDSDSLCTGSFFVERCIGEIRRLGKTSLDAPGRRIPLFLFDRLELPVLSSVSSSPLLLCSWFVAAFIVSIDGVDVVPVAAVPVVVVGLPLFTTGDSDCFHIRQPSKSIRACIHPHSMIFFSSHSRLTGFVRKSLHPAARAACRSDSRDDAVNATMITGD